MATSINLSKITKVDLRNCWQNEATDFTPWLATEENMSLLADALEMIMVSPLQLVFNQHQFVCP